MSKTTKARILFLVFTPYPCTLVCWFRRLSAFHLPSHSSAIRAYLTCSDGAGRLNVGHRSPSAGPVAHDVRPSCHAEVTIRRRCKASRKTQRTAVHLVVDAAMCCLFLPAYPIGCIFPKECCTPAARASPSATTDSAVLHPFFWQAAPAP